MRSYQVFASMTPERASEFMQALQERAPALFATALHAASAAMRARPVYVQKLPFEKRAAAMRRALARVQSNVLAEEILAVYFLDCRKDLLIEWLDALGIAHEEGTLKEGAPAEPSSETLAAALEKFRRPEDAADRELLLQAFAAQSAVDWPGLEQRLSAPAR